VLTAMQRKDDLVAVIGARTNNIVALITTKRLHQSHQVLMTSSHFEVSESIASDESTSSCRFQYGKSTRDSSTLYSPGVCMTSSHAVPPHTGKHN
jgi:3-oxoacyl-ACP reductase-like protein